MAHYVWCALVEICSVMSSDHRPVTYPTMNRNQPCQHRLLQATTPSTNSGHPWQCMAREHPSEGNYGASTNTQSERL